MPKVFVCSKCKRAFLTSTYGLLEHYDICRGKKVNLTNVNKATKRCKVQPP